MTNFPRTLLVKVMGDGGEDDEPYYIACPEDQIDTLVETGETVRIATYQLVSIEEAEGLVRRHPARAEEG